VRDNRTGKKLIVELVVQPFPGSDALKPSERQLDKDDSGAAAVVCGVWIVRGVKKANAMAAASAARFLIFTGRYSTPRKVSDWLDQHPRFRGWPCLAPQRGS